MSTRCVLLPSIQRQVRSTCEHKDAALRDDLVVIEGLRLLAGLAELAVGQLGKEAVWRRNGTAVRSSA